MEKKYITVRLEPTLNFQKVAVEAQIAIDEVAIEIPKLRKIAMDELIILDKSVNHVKSQQPINNVPIFKSNVKMQGPDEQKLNSKGFKMYTIGPAGGEIAKAPILVKEVEAYNEYRKSNPSVLPIWQRTKKDIVKIYNDIQNNVAAKQAYEQENYATQPWEME